MTSEFRLVVRDAYLASIDGIRDIGIRDGRIAEVAPSISETGDAEIDANRNLVSPGLVDSHKHLDRALSATGSRRPLANDRPNESPAYVGGKFDRYFGDTPVEDLTDTICENIRMAVAAGTTHIRSHVGVDHSVGTKTVEACLRAIQRTSDIVDVQLVPYASRGVRSERGERLLREAIESCLDGPLTREEVFVGGSIGLIGGSNTMPAVDATMDAWFDIATAYDIGVDVHVTGRESFGYYTLKKLAEKTIANDYRGDVTAVHSWALAHLPDWWLEDLLNELSTANVTVVTCYNSIRPEMPVEALVDHGVTLAHGTDNDQDFVYPHGNADQLEAAMVMSYKLVGDWHFDERYRWAETNPALNLYWEMLTTQGAVALNIPDEYGIEPGAKADIVVYDEPSPQWAIVRQATRAHVIKDGAIVAEDGDVAPSAVGWD